MGVASKLRLLVVGAALSARCLNAADPGIFEIRAVTATPTQTTTAYSLYHRDGRNERLLVEPEVLLDQRAIKTARLGRGSDGASQIRLGLSKEGHSKFLEIMQKFQNKRLAIFLNGSLEAAPTVGQSMNGDSVIVSEQFSEGVANDLVSKLNAIANMFELRVVADKPTRTSEAYSLTAGGGKSEQIFVEPDVLLDWSSVRWIGRGFGRENDVPNIGLCLSKDGTQKFAEITKKYHGRRVAIFLKGQLQSVSQIENLRGIRGDDTVVISGDFDSQFISDLNAAVRSGPLPPELQPVKDLSQYETGESLWALLQQQLEFEKHLHPGETWTTTEVRARNDRQDAIVGELLKRFPDDPHKWEAKKIKVENTRDYEEANKLREELSTTSDVPADIRKWARFEWLQLDVVGQGRSGQTEVEDYCRQYPEDVAGCEDLRFSSGQWYLYSRDAANRQKGEAILENLSASATTGIRAQAQKLLAKKFEIYKVIDQRVKEEKVQHDRAEAESRGTIGKLFTVKAPAIDHSTIETDQLHDKVILVDFWATWCGPCRQDVPHMISVYKRYHDRGLEVIGVANDSSDDVVQKFVAANGMAWPQCVDRQGLSGTYKVSGIPTLVLVSKKGLIAANSTTLFADTKTEAERKERLAVEIEKLLAE